MLNLLTETGMLGCRPAITSIDQRHKFSMNAGEAVDQENQRLV